MEYFLQLLPQTAGSWTIQIAGGIAGSLILMSFVEYFIHGFFMHQKLLPAFMYRLIPPFENAFLEHSTLHHDTYFKQFNYEPNPVGRNLNMYIQPMTTIGGLLACLPFMILFALYVSFIPPLIFFIVFMLHNFMWNIIHPEMHQPRHPFWSRWAIYKFLARHHYLHHTLHGQHIHRHNNIILPIADFILGQNVVPNEEQRSEMKKFGYLD